MLKGISRWGKGKGVLCSNLCIKNNYKTFKDLKLNIFICGF